MSRITNVGRAILGQATAARPEQRESRRQLLRFVVIGSTSVLIDLLCYHLLTRNGMSPSPAKGVAYLIGMLFGFMGNKFWTFRSASKSLAEPIIFVLLYTVTLGVNVGINALALMVFGSEAKLLAFLIATGVTTVLNFVGMKLLAFRAGIQKRQGG